MIKKKTGMKKRENRNKKIIIVLLIFLVSSTNVFSQEEDRKIADLYISTADSFFKNSELEKAEVFLNKSMLYYKDSSDAYYLKSLINEKKSGYTDLIINDIKKALILRNWNVYKEEDAFLKLGIIYSSVKQYKKAVSTLYVVESEKIDNENYLEAYTNSLLNSGMFSTAAEILKIAVAKFPENKRFRKQLINTDPSYYESTLIKILDKNEIYDFDPEIILEVLKNTDDDGIKRELYEKISSYSKEYPEIIIEKIKIEKTAEEKDIEQFFEYKGYENLRYLKEMGNILEDMNMDEFYYKKLSSLSSIIYDDINNDGTSEIIFRVENGIPVWYREDYNQDGLNDFYIYYTNGKIETIEYNEKYLVKYYKYPILENIIINSDEIDIYDFSDRNRLFEAVDSQKLFSIPEIKKDFNERIEKLLPKAAVHRKNIPEENIRIIEYNKNNRIKMYTEIRNNQAVSEGLIKDGEFKYINRDRNDENSFETKEIYKNGKLSSILYDGNNDGIYEMKIENNTKYWDYNSDGLYDSFEKKDNGETVKGYSSEYNGIFDIEEKSINGTIVAVKKDSKWFDVKYDSKNRIYWIGEIVKNIRIDKKEENSYLNTGGYQIHVYKIADNYYAEVIN